MTITVDSFRIHLVDSLMSLSDEIQTLHLHEWSTTARGRALTARMAELQTTLWVITEYRDSALAPEDRAIPRI